MATVGNEPIPARYPLLVRVGNIAQDTYVAVTTADPQIAPGDLELLLKPLRRKQLVVEVEAWLGLLQEKVQQISLAEIEMKKKSREISDTKDDIKKQVKEIKKEDQAKAEEPNAPPAAVEPNAASAKANEEIQEKVETIGEQTEKIAEAGQEATKAVADINTVDEEKVRSSEKDLIEKTEAVEQAKEKLKETAAEVSQGDLEVEEKVKKIGQAEIELHTKVKEQLLANINKLREEQTALTDRVRVAIAALKAKGGDVKEYEQYVDAVSGLKVDVTDISAARAIILGWLKSPEGGLRWGKSILSFIVILIAAKILAIILEMFTCRALAMNKKCGDLLRNFLVHVVGKVVMVIGIVVALSMLGRDAQRQGAVRRRRRLYPLPAA